MNKLNRSGVPVPVSPLVSSVVVVVLVLAGCASNREIDRDREITSGTHNAGSAFDSDYFVGRGAVLEAGFARSCRFYIESGGTLRGLGHGFRDSTVYAERGAHIEKRPELQVMTVKNARKAFADRNKLVSQELGPGVGSGPLLAAGGGGHYHRHDDDDDDDDNYRRRSRIRDVKISDSSYKKKD